MDNIFAKVELEAAEKGQVYPCTLVMDRYTGTYSGAKWLAFAEDTEGIPSDIGGDDSTEDHFWRTYAEHPNPKPIGKGESPNAAYDDLLNKYKEWIKKRLI